MVYNLQQLFVYLQALAFVQGSENKDQVKKDARTLRSEIHHLQSDICSPVLCSFGLPCNVVDLFTFRYGMEEKLKVGCHFKRVTWHEVTRKKDAMSRCHRLQGRLEFMPRQLCPEACIIQCPSSWATACLPAVCSRKRLSLLPAPTV